MGKRGAKRGAWALKHWRALVAALAAVAVVAIALIWPGFSTEQTPLASGSVWVLQSGTGNHYARFNAAVNELDTVKQAANPSSLAQTTSNVLLFTDGGAKFADVNLGNPINIDGSTPDQLTASPTGTNGVVSSGNTIAFITEGGSVYLGTISGGGQASKLNLNNSGNSSQDFVASAIALSPNGTLVAYSAKSQEVVRVDSASGAVQGRDSLDLASTTAQITMVNSTWAVLDPSNGKLYLRGKSGAIDTGVSAQAKLQTPSATGNAVLIGDTTGLRSVPTDGSQPSWQVGTGSSALGVPAAPQVQNGQSDAAWLPTGTAGGTLWSSSQGEVALSYNNTDIGSDPSPVFQTNGGVTALNDVHSGWVWTVPGGTLVTSSQSWTSDQKSTEANKQQQQAQKVVDPKPPVAENDSFGVRAGRQVSLPVLLNDHDPNEDVLTIDPASIKGLPSSFGTVSVTNQNQMLAVNVAAGASGSATFQYRITDGTGSDGGLYSNMATVTLNVVPDSVNHPPVWCGVDGCLATWPSPQLAPGGSASADALSGWVDPDGDPIYVSSAVNQGSVGSVVWESTGQVVYQHPDPNSKDAVSAPINVTVSDSRGATAQKVMTFSVTPTPRLTAQNFAVTGVVGQPVTVSVASHVSGSNGTVRVTAAQSRTTSGGVQTSVNAGTAAFTLTANAAGSYLVNYTVQDAQGSTTGLARVVLVDGGKAQISAAPVTAFVRPGEDTTVDILPSVTNPAGKVLLLSNVISTADAHANLSVDTVAQYQLRVTGNTDTGQAGVLGHVTYTISDGTGTATGTTQGELTVMLLAAATPTAPIARDDAITVRAGAQVDIPVLDNDLGSAGQMLAIDPQSVVNVNKAGLAFASGRYIRYLAPSQAGTYALTYSIYPLGSPELVDSAQVLVTVVGDGSNSAPNPVDLNGRVLSGQSVSIAFNGFGLDPDGDVVKLDTIPTQPSSGSATISADGSSIVYTSVAGFQGQVSFPFRVRDSRGATATATVRVGVLDEKANPSPITYSDYAQVQVGADNQAVVYPTLNDIDPAGTTLKLGEVKPNAQAGTTEYTQMQSMIKGVDGNKVTFTAGTVLGTYSFTYQVSNTRGDTSIGLIVLKVVRVTVPDAPQVQDTTLTAETLDSFSGGIDVVSGKVSWVSGDVSQLSLQLWNAPAGVSSNGWKISGSAPKESELVPFKLTGKNFLGQDVETYGFLRVPGQNDIRLALKSTVGAQQVNEKQSVSFDMAQLVAVPSGHSLQVDGSGVVAGGARSNAQCVLASGTTVQYNAGANAPWSDTCVVPVKFDGQTVYSYLTVPIKVIAELPQPELRSASITVAPGDTQTYDLKQMTSWSGPEDWANIKYAIAYTGTQFTVTLADNIVTVVGKDAAKPGTIEPITVTVTSHQNVKPGTLNLEVGPAPSVLPKGATVNQKCVANSGTSCDITVIGQAGEVNPLPGTPLQVVSVSASSTACPKVTFSVLNTTTIRASWQQDAAGAQCGAQFVVQDAQGRQSAGDRNGAVALDFQGFPAAPQNVVQRAYTGTSVTLSVSPGDAAHTYPAITGFVITENGHDVTTCDANGGCPDIISLTNGEQHTYQAYAVNSVGRSLTSVPVTAWAFEPLPAVVGDAIPTGDGTAQLRLTGIDSRATRLSIVINGSAQSTTGYSPGASTANISISAANAGVGVQVTALRDISAPSAASGPSTENVTTISAHGVGTPVFDFSPTSVDLGVPTTITAALHDGNGGSQSTVYAYFASACGSTTGGSQAPISTQVTLDANTPSTTLTLCTYYSESFGSTQVTFPTGSQTQVISRTIPVPVVSSGFVIADTPSCLAVFANMVCNYNAITAPTVSAPTAANELRYSYSGTAGTFATGPFSLPVGAGTDVWVKACISGTSNCSDPVQVTAQSGPSYRPQVTSPTLCTGGQPPTPIFDSTTQATPANAVVATYAKAPAGFSVVVTWSGQLQGLSQITNSLDCQ